MRQSINRKKLLCLLILALLAAVGYMTIGVKFANSKLASYAMRIRTPKLLAMLRMRSARHPSYSSPLSIIRL